MSTSTKHPLTALPYACSKQKLYVMYADQMSEDTIRREINNIIIDFRKLTPGTQPKVQMIRHLELQEFVATHALPRGFYNPYQEKE